jgi:hypothetical protein
MKVDFLEAQPRSSDAHDAAHSRAADPPRADALRPRRRGRPFATPPEDVLARIRSLAVRNGGLFRAHLIEPALYARARRLFGSWEGAVRAAGLDYAEAIHLAQQRAGQSRRLTWRRQRL